MKASAPLAATDHMEVGGPRTLVVLERREGAPALDSLGARRLFLVVRGLHADLAPGVLYHLYLGLPAGATPAEDDPRHAGAVNFYGAPAGAAKGDPNRIFYSFDVTEVVRHLRASGALDGPLTLTAIAAGAPQPEAKPILGRVELVAE